ncbi:MAG: PEGA domain-containing protein [Methanoregula sp.]|nr:PEGA domain-containing protein [Methanoregula sp.]
MKLSHQFSCLILFTLLLIVAVPVSAETSTITKISPAVGYTGSTATVTVTGTFENTTPSEVRLMMNGKTNITSYTLTSATNTTIVARITISSSASTGTWSLVVYNEDYSESSNHKSFTIKAPMTLTSISPVSARANNDSVDVTIVGTGLSDVTDIYLRNEDYKNITASNVYTASATKLTGTFDLTDKDEDTYDVCVLDSFGGVECDLSFKIITDAVGSLDVSSSPSGAQIYVDAAYMGTTPDTIDELDIGTHKMILKKTGYVDYAKSIKITEGDTTTVDADLNVITTAPTTVTTTVRTTAPTTVKTTRKSTITTPTPWPSATATPASPVGTLAIIGTICLAFIVLRKH